MGIDELGEASRPLRIDTPLSQRSLSWWLFYMPGTVILWFGYMFPNSIVGGISGARQRNVPVIQLGMTLMFYAGIGAVCLILYVMYQNGKPDDPKPVAAISVQATREIERSPPLAETEQRLAAVETEETAQPEAEVEDPLKKEVNSRLTPQYSSCMSAALATGDMLDCIAAETKVQDDALNATYKRVMGKMEPGAQATVRQAQRAWIQERDEQCDKEAAEFEGGSLAQVTQADCYLRKEIERTIQLEWIEPR